MNAISDVLAKILPQRRGAVPARASSGSEALMAADLEAAGVGEDQGEPPQTLYAVFTGETDLPLLRRLLRPGYRHCFAILNDGRSWLSFDPLAQRTAIAVYHHLPQDFDLPGWLRARGLAVVPAGPAARNSAGRAVFKTTPFLPYSCVEAVKRLLGIRAWLVLTPWQLYRHMQKHSPTPPSTSKGDPSWAA